MYQLLRQQQVVHGETSRAACRVEQFLGGGGQGEVYKVNIGGSTMALKWYFPHVATPEQRKSLEVLVVKGPPNNSFLWPMEMVSDRKVPGYGYVMPLRDARFKGIIDLMKGSAKGITYRALATAGYQLVENYYQLHCMGLCYRDINFGNVFFDPATGDVRICDNDNVCVNNDKEAALSVLGTPRFMAPEIVRGEALPSTDTDRYSLAVLLFYIFMVSDPLAGKRESSIKAFDDKAMRKLYGADPLFIFDPDDHSNEPDPLHHKNAMAYWPLYPQFLRDLFIQSFTKGLRDPQNGRVTENPWRAALVKLRDSIYYCRTCREEVFYDPAAIKAAGGKPDKCWSCGKELSLPFRMRIVGQETMIMLNLETKLYPHHLDSNRQYDFSQPLAEVITHPKDPSIQGLRNLSTKKWNMTNANKEVRDVEPGRSVTIASGTKISFGNIEGEFRL
ncbi:MAG: serine/threonine protein kinase [Planctomycetes bacterium]|nr:serine/threonine protein kinase [Planctomycetota bacterium]